MLNEMLMFKRKWMKFKRNVQWNFHWNVQWNVQWNFHWNVQWNVQWNVNVQTKINEILKLNIKWMKC